MARVSTSRSRRSTMMEVVRLWMLLLLLVERRALALTGCVLFLLSTFQQRWLSTGEYHESGPIMVSSQSCMVHVDARRISFSLFRSNSSYLLLLAFLLTVHPPRTRFLMHSCCTVMLSLTSRTDLTHHAWLKNYGAHCQCLCPKTFTLHREMSYVTPQLMTPSTGRVLPSASTNPAEIYGHS